jgi:hypothetical protein
MEARAAKGGAKAAAWRIAWRMSRQNGLTSANATGMTLSHVRDVLIKWLGKTSSCLMATSAFLVMIEARLFLLS